MKVLYLHHNQPDYLAESLFHGLRSLLGKNCVDVPRYDSMYSPLTDKMRSKLRGHGFTLYGLLEDIPELADERYFYRQDLDSYDLIVIGTIWWQWSLFWDLSTIVDSKKIVVLDGDDSAPLFPFTSLGWRLKNFPWSYLTPLNKTKYFKRELIGEGYSYSLNRFLPRQLHKWISIPKNVMPIGFSIPQEKISKVKPSDKTKDFPQHIVDLDVSRHILNSAENYAFSSEHDYYQDLKISRYGITMKRAGWDCLRHYELAANGCVLCFRDLDLKPDTCSPHGLNESNCIVYHSYDELIDRISSISENEYCRLLNKTYEWIESNTTLSSAKNFLKLC